MSRQDFNSFTISYMAKMFLTLSAHDKTKFNEFDEKMKMYDVIIKTREKARTLSDVELALFLEGEKDSALNVIIDSLVSDIRHGPIAVTQFDFFQKATVELEK